MGTAGRFSLLLLLGVASALIATVLFPAEWSAQSPGIAWGTIAIGAATPTLVGAVAQSVRPRGYFAVVAAMALGFGFAIGVMAAIRGTLDSPPITNFTWAFGFVSIVALSTAWIVGALVIAVRALLTQASPSGWR